MEQAITIQESQIIKKKETNFIDNYDINIFIKRWSCFLNYLLNCQEMREFGIRMPNFPEDISENFVKFVIKKFQKDDSVIWSENGDLFSESDGKIEVKCFSSFGPTSFGPTEIWDNIYFLDATKCIEGHFVLYRLKISNTSDDWKNLKMNKKKGETYNDHCKQGRRPRLSWDSIKKQLSPSKIEKIFEGDIGMLLN